MTSHNEKEEEEEGRYIHPLREEKRGRKTTSNTLSVRCTDPVNFTPFRRNSTRHVYFMSGVKFPNHIFY